MSRRPEQLHARADGTVQLWFHGEEATPLDGVYFMRGGICWPGETTKAAFEENMAGFALVAGVRADGADVAKQTVEIFAEHVFSTVDNVVENGRLASHGLAPWMSRAMGDWGCKLWYAGRGDARPDSFLRDIRRGGLDVAKAARFFAVDETLEACIGMLVDAMNERRLRYDGGGEVHNAMRDYKASEGNVVGPALAAAARLCAGIRKRPPRIRGDGWLENFRPD
jgi:hypothetical protein